MTGPHMEIVQPASVPDTTRRVAIATDTHGITVKNPDHISVRRKHGKNIFSVPSDTIPPPQENSVTVKNTSLP